MLFFPFPLDLIPTLVDLGPRKRPKRCEIDLNSRRKETLFKWVSGSIFFRKIYTEQTARHLRVRLHNMFWKFSCENTLIHLSHCLFVCFIACSMCWYLQRSLRSWAHLGAVVYLQNLVPDPMCIQRGPSLVYHRLISEEAFSLF